MNELDKTMYFGAKPDIFEKAKALRKNMTGAEKALWERLKNKQILSLRFEDSIPSIFSLLIFIVILLD